MTNAMDDCRRLKSLTHSVSSKLKDDSQIRQTIEVRIACDRVALGRSAIAEILEPKVNGQLLPMQIHELVRPD